MNNDQKRYWQSYYRTHRDPGSNTAFSQFCLDKFLSGCGSLLEIGCGNGRDAVFFAANGLDVTALDQIGEEIDYLNRTRATDKLRFIEADISEPLNVGSFDCIYMRFSLHSVSAGVQERFLSGLNGHLNEGGLYLVEARSVKDDMYSAGVQISKDENITDHYRRYIDKEALASTLKNLGHRIIYQTESRGLAKYGDEDPVVIRIASQKAQNCRA